MDDFELIDLPREPRSESRIIWYDAFGRPIEHFSLSGRTVANTETTCGLRVSTVLLSIDHSFGLGASTVPLRIFETMIFGEAVVAEYQWRYSTMMEALIAHDQIVSQIEAGVILDDIIVEPTMTDLFEAYRTAISGMISLYVVGGVAQR